VTHAVARLRERKVSFVPHFSHILFLRASIDLLHEKEYSIVMPDSFWTIPLLFATGVAAGLVDSIAGGGGLITLPVLLGIGLPPQVALGTNKFQSSFGSFTATAYHVRKKNIDLRTARSGIISTLVGAALGAWAVQQIDATILGKIIPFMLAGILIYTFFTPRLGDVDQRPKMESNLAFALTGICFGFYDGFFGPGVGSFWAISFVVLLGFNLAKATGYTKLMNFTSNVVSLIVFSIGGHVWFTSGLAMAAGQILGARLGSGLVIRKGASFVRPIFVSVVIVMILKLFHDEFIAGN
jgi:uncharacterized membrane protein YfcA